MAGYVAPPFSLASPNRSLSLILKSSCGSGGTDQAQPDTALTGPTAVANPWRMHGDRTKAGHDLALRPMPVAHQPLAAVFGVLVSVAGKEGGDLRLDGLRQQRSRARAQNFGERVGELGWLDQLDDIILDHRVSLLCWRSGGLEHPHDTPPYPLTPSPTSAHSSGHFVLITSDCYSGISIIETVVPPPIARVIPT